ncbi:acyl carrier protein [Oscillatoriales cyanobacterium LEGE 11467]|uniref:Acyl carrier protein n=1 Tax=Zarconia navalis LEGE 11467 TaxID=1828826 RepID=A0A928Z6G7_9CYAN|nr:acyl carrier protein [Zarconia navalis]MBE9039475.1 acyl carrier protein [Zarconia navalis LEGE 11467]
MTQAKNHTSHNIKNLIKKQILTEFMSSQPEEDLDNDLLLIEQGIIDSMGIFRLINFLEDEFSIAFDPEELMLENFATINAIHDFVISKVES